MSRLFCFVFFAFLISCGDKDDSEVLVVIVPEADTDTDTDEDPWAALEELNGKITIPTLFEGRLIPRAAQSLKSCVRRCAALLLGNSSNLY